LYFLKNCAAAVFDDRDHVAVISIGDWFGLNSSWDVGPTGHPRRDESTGRVATDLALRCVLEMIAIETNITNNPASIRSLLIDRRNSPEPPSEVECV
jgi:hypothetical protein